jgi:hypothetical protein
MCRTFWPKVIHAQKRCLLLLVAVDAVVVVVIVVTAAAVAAPDAGCRLSITFRLTSALLRLIGLLPARAKSEFWTHNIIPHSTMSQLCDRSNLEGHTD